MEKSPNNTCNKCGKSFNHKIKLAVHTKYKHPKNPSLSKQLLDNCDQSSESGAVRLWEFSNENKKPWEPPLTQGINMEIVGGTFLEHKDECFTEIQEQRSVNLREDISTPVLTDSYGCDLAQKFPENDPQQGINENDNDQPLTGSSPSSDPPSKNKHSKNGKRKHDEPDIWREPQNKLLKISTPSKFSGTSPEESWDGVETLKRQSSTKKQQSKLEENSSERRFSCKFCEYRTNQSSHLRNHERTHTGEKPYKCQHCSYSATQSSSVRKHERIHTGEKPYKCKHCDYSSTTTSRLRVHERTHTGERPYQCGWCGYTAKSFSNMQVHVRTHTAEKPYKCKHCSYSATEKSSVRKHERTHTGEKPYKCKHCDYSSTTTSRLRVHERTHTGERPYQCGWCDYTANSFPNMQGHVRTHTGDI